MDAIKKTGKAPLVLTHGSELKVEDVFGDGDQVAQLHSCFCTSLN